MDLEFIYERSVTMPLLENTAEAAIQTAIGLSHETAGVAYDKTKITRFTYDGVVIRVDSKSKLWRIWWEFYLIKNNRFVRENGVVPHPKKLDKETFISAIFYCCPCKFNTVEEAVADYEAAYKED